ncbi:MAG TPA: efflux RND transporter periplasmic adaptor subunit [Kofleriaceae bacterium]|nr:efflux RND transporter periplasmic adaptor subunit [Kofleriaceae bacterium]
MNRKNKGWLGALVLAAVAAGGVLVYTKVRASGDEGPRYQTAPVTRGRVSSQVTATGTLSPLVTVQVGAQVTGRVQELMADFNSVVKKGQVIAKIDPQLTESDVARARASLTAAAAQVTRAEADLRDAKQKADRAKALAAQGLIAQAEEDTARATQDSAAASVVAARAATAQARATLDQQKTNLTYTTIVSPIDGVVISRSVDVGQTVSASLQAPVLFTIAEDLAKMEVHTSVAESDVGSLQNGMAVEFTVDAFPRDTFKGVVKQVRYSPTTVSNVVTYDAVVAVENPELKLRPGMTANVTFVVQEREDVLAVPSAALRFRPAPEVLAELGISEEELSWRPKKEEGGAKAAEGGTPTGRRARGGERSEGGRNQRMIWKLTGGTLAPVRVKVGISDGRQTEITEGELAEGDLIVTGMAGAAAAPPGQDGQNRGGNQGGAARRRPPGFL